MDRSFLGRRRRAVAALWLLAAGLPAVAAAQPPPPQPPSGSALTPPRLVRDALPVYPAGEASESPVVVGLDLTVDATGAVTDVAVAESGGPAFDQSAVAAARQLGFEPARRGDVAIAARIRFRFEFAPRPPVAPVPPPATGVPVDTAPDEPFAPVPTGIQEIDVVGARPPREVTRRPLEQREIARIPGTNGDALRAIENMPGVARSPGLQAQLVVRGSAPIDTRVYVDGTQIPNAYHFGGFNSVVPPELLSRIEFLPGNFGPEYARAMGGVVDLGIRSPARDGFHAVAQVDVVDARMVLETPLGEHTRLLVAGRRSYVDAWISGVIESGGGTEVSTAPVYYDYQAVLEQDLGPHTTGRILFMGSDDRLAFRLQAPEGDPTISGDLDNQVRFWRVQARTDTALSPDTRWVNQLAYGVDTTRFTSDGVDLDIDLGGLQGRSDLRHTFSRALTAVAGLDMTYGQGDASVLGPPIPEDGQNNGPGFARPRQREELSADIFRFGAYALFELSPVRRLRLLPSVRADFTSDIDQWTVAPRLAARWQVAGDDMPTTVKAGAGLYYQPPQLHESFPPFGSDELDNNRAQHYSLGLEQGLGGNLHVSLEGFYKRLDRLVDQRPDATASEYGVTYVNSGSGRIFGSELFLRYDADDRFFGWISYTLSRSQRRDSDMEEYRMFDFDQTHILSALGSFRLGGGWEVGARFRYVTGTPSTPPVGAIYDADAGAYAPINGTPFSARDEAFHQLDLRVDKSWTMQSWRLSAYLDVQNAYNRRNPEGQQYNFNYSQADVIPGLPIIPVIGIRGEL